MCSDPLSKRDQTRLRIEGAGAQVEKLAEKPPSSPSASHLGLGTATVCGGGVVVHEHLPPRPGVLTEIIRSGGLIDESVG